MTRNTDGRIVSRYGNHETGTVFIDDSPNAKPSERFKMVSTSTIDGKQGLWVCASPDGIHGWRETSSVPAMTGSDTKDVAFFDHAINKYGSLNGGDHSFASRFRPFRNRPPVFWCHVLDSWHQDGKTAKNGERTSKNGRDMV